MHSIYSIIITSSKVGCFASHTGEDARWVSGISELALELKLVAGYVPRIRAQGQGLASRWSFLCTAYPTVMTCSYLRWLTNRSLSSSLTGDIVLLSSLLQWDFSCLWQFLFFPHVNATFTALSCPRFWHFTYIKLFLMFMTFANSSSSVKHKILKGL